MLRWFLTRRVRGVPSGNRKLFAKLQVETLESRFVPAACTIAANTCFAIIGDYGSAGAAERDVAELVKSWDPDFIVTTGDNNYPDGSAATIDANIGQYYHEFIYPYNGRYGPGATTNRFFPSLGNHDWRAANAQPYLDYFTLPGNERYYTVRKGPVELFILDSDGQEPDGTTSDSVQGRWLQNRLANSGARWKIVVFHHSPYSSGSTHGSITGMRWPFEAWGATAVVSGHEHNYERILQKGIPYFVNGAGGVNLYPIGSPISGSAVRYDDDYGAMLVDASSSSITFRFIDRNGSVIDSYSIGQSSGVPTVSIVATDSLAAEPANSGTFTIRRTGSVSQALSVHYTIGGNARSGTDYQSLGGSITIPAGQATAAIAIVPRDDAVREATETVVLQLSPRSNYQLSGDSATVQIRDDDGGTKKVQATLIATGVSWRYNDSGSDLRKSWRGQAYDDSGWAFGSAELGYGDGDEKTVVGFGKNASKKNITTYFRRSFDLSNPGAYQNLLLRLRRDDGAVVYLNGEEVFRSNMPKGKIDYRTKAVEEITGSNENAFLDATIGSSLLRTGTNVIAVEIHQRSRDDADISFDFELIGNAK